MKDQIKVILMALECLLKTVASNEVKPWKISKEEISKERQPVILDEYLLWKEFKLNEEEK